MGKRTRAKLQEREEKVAKQAAVLSGRHNYLVAKPDRSEITWGRFEPAVRHFRNRYLREPSDWVYKGKSNDTRKIYRSFLQFVFCRYRVPHCLEHFWVEEDAKTGFFGSPQASKQAALSPGRILPKLWYLVVAQGGSLYNEGGKAYLTRKEIHHLLADSGTLSLSAAIIHAVALAEAGSRKIAASLAASKISAQSLFHDQGFHANTYNWIKFLARNMNEGFLDYRQINDLTDYYAFALQNPNFDLKGRKIPALQKAMVAWHHDLARQRNIKGGTWQGLPIADQYFVTGPERKQSSWQMHQITTGDELYEEGKAQHHCVAGYKRTCMDGQCSIFSLTRREPMQPDYRRQVTLEVRHEEVVQARRFANARITPQDLEVIRTWAGNNGLRLSGYL